VLAGDPGASCHAKIINELTVWDVQPHRDGIDRGAIIDMMEINGCDTRLVIPAQNTPTACASLDSNYTLGISWVEPAVSYDFQRSRNASKAIKGIFAFKPN
jgi:hypothetical protein